MCGCWEKFQIKYNQIVSPASRPWLLSRYYAMTNYKYIVFDFDGTLVDSRALFISLYNELAAKKGYKPMTSENLQHLRTLSIPERCKLLGVPMYKIPFLIGPIMKQYGESLSNLQFNPGVDEMLTALSQKGVAYAVLSSNSKKNIEAFFKLKGVANGNDIYCSRSIFGKHVLLDKFLKAKRLNPADILYVGDELRDIEACRKIGVPVAWVSWGYDTEEVLKNNKPDYIIHDPADILTLAWQFSG